MVEVTETLQSLEAKLAKSKKGAYILCCAYTTVIHTYVYVYICNGFTLRSKGYTVQFTTLWNVVTTNELSANLAVWYLHVLLPNAVTTCEGVAYKGCYSLHQESVYNEHVESFQLLYIINLHLWLRWQLNVFITLRESYVCMYCLTYVRIHIRTLQLIHIICVHT